MRTKSTSDKIRAEIRTKIRDWSEKYAAGFFPEATKLLKTVRTAILVAIAVQITFVIAVIALLVYFFSKG